MQAKICCDILLLSQWCIFKIINSKLVADWLNSSDVSTSVHQWKMQTLMTSDPPSTIWRKQNHMFLPKKQQSPSFIYQNGTFIIVVYVVSFWTLFNYVIKKRQYSTLPTHYPPMTGPSYWYMKLSWFIQLHSHVWLFTCLLNDDCVLCLWKFVCFFDIMNKRKQTNHQVPFKNLRKNHILKKKIIWMELIQWKKS